MSERIVKICQDCGRDFFGWPSQRRCQSCAALAKFSDKDRELDDEKTGWRHMCRDRTGTVIVPGGNVMMALDDLCAYEEACETVGAKGPGELARLLANVKWWIPAKEMRRWCTELCGGAQEGGRTARTTGLRQSKSSSFRDEDGKIIYTCRVCGSCGSFRPDSENKHGAAGTCVKHPKRVHSLGGRKGPMKTVPGEFRHVAGAREACRDWTTKEENAAPQELTPRGKPPEWVGPSAELLPEETIE